MNATVLHLPADLDRENVQLPRTYKDAKTSLAQCQKIEECKDWADKAAALASYAMQAGDQSLAEMARRIQGRAYRRCGELLKEIEPGGGVDSQRDHLTAWRYGG